MIAFLALAIATTTLDRTLMCDGRTGVGARASFDVSLRGDDNAATVAITPRQGSAWPQLPVRMLKVDGIINDFGKDGRSEWVYWTAGRVTVAAVVYEIGLDTPIDTKSLRASAVRFGEVNKIDSTNSQDPNLSTLQCSVETQITGPTAK